MANPRTQIRLQQLTGSAVDIKTDIGTKKLATAVNENNLQGLLGEFAGALQRIHGAASNEYLNNDASVLLDSNGDTRISYANSGDTTIAGDNGTVDLTISDSLVRCHDDLQVDGNATIIGNLKVTGGTTTTYISSSVVEYQDPMLVTNAADMSGDGSVVKKSGTSFLSASTDIETNSGTALYDYGVLSKRAIGYNVALNAASGRAGASNGVSSTGQIKSLERMTEGAGAAADLKFSTNLVGSVFGIFKTSAVSGDTAAAAGGEKTFTLLTADNVRTGARNVDILDAHKGAFVVVSSSHGSGKKKFGVIKGRGSGGDANNIVINLLKNTEKYDNVSATDAINQSEFSTAFSGSIQLLSAYAGTVFNKDDFEFHHAAAAITGSGDNAFLSGSANILLYGGVNSAKMTLHSNNLISGSTAIADFDLAHENEAGTSTVSFARLQSLGSKDLMLKSAGDLILSASSGGNVRMVTNDGSTIKFPIANGTENQLMAVNGSGDLAFIDASSLPGLESSKRTSFNVKTTIAAGADKLILTASNFINGAASHMFGVLSNSPYTGSLATDIHALSNPVDKLELYVNGQLLSSGSKAAGGLGVTVDSGDYCIVSTSTSAVSASFAFNLEADDILTVAIR